MTSTIRPIANQDVPRGSREILELLEESLGCRSNFLLTAAHSPSALEALYGWTRAATRTAFPETLREAIALRVAQLNGCEYCVAVRTDRAHAAGLDEASVEDYRRGISDDPKEQALLSLATKIVEDRGHHAGFAVQIARNASTTDAEIVEVMLLVTLSIFSNYLNNLAGTELDVPSVDLTLPAERDSSKGGMR